jgi:sphingolipid delta-4 desaturase
MQAHGYNPTFGTTTKKAPNDFSWTYTDEPHATRRKLILAKYPQVADLCRPEPLTAALVLLEVSIQLFAAWYCREASWGFIFVLAYVLGGTINHSLQLAVHELSHNLAFESPNANKALALFANMPTCLPSCITFQRYHLDHHQFQGVDGIDTDIPCGAEVHYVTNTLMKFGWIICQPLAYAFRPMFIKPKPMVLWEVVNWVTALSFDALVVYLLGTKGFAYLILGTLLGLGLHPTAGHFIAEHYEFMKGQETYSYYGPCNWVNFNVGYHNEHHDFPRIPWSRLPALKAMAPEFYDSLPSYTSYIAVIYQFITDPEMGCFSRIKRGIDSTKRERLDKSTDQSQYKLFRIVCVGAMGTVLTLVAASAIL